MCPQRSSSHHCTLKCFLCFLLTRCIAAQLCSRAASPTRAPSVHPRFACFTRHGLHVACLACRVCGWRASVRACALSYMVGSRPALLLPPPPRKPLFPRHPQSPRVNPVTPCPTPPPLSPSSHWPTQRWWAGTWWAGVWARAASAPCGRAPPPSPAPLWPSSSYPRCGGALCGAVLLWVLCGAVLFWVLCGAVLLWVLCGAVW